MHAFEKEPGAFPRASGFFHYITKHCITQCRRCRNLNLIRRNSVERGTLMSISLGTILLVLLVLMLLGAIPSWPHSKAWGYGPSGALGTIAIVVLILVVLGRI